MRSLWNEEEKFNERNVSGLYRLSITTAMTPPFCNAIINLKADRLSHALRNAINIQ